MLGAVGLLSFSLTMACGRCPVVCCRVADFVATSHQLSLLRNESCGG